MTEQSFYEIKSLMQKIGGMMHAWHQVQPCKNMSPKQFHTLARVQVLMQEELAYAQGVTIGELAQALRISAPAVSQVVSALVDAGFLMRVNDAQDRRIVRIVPTEQGSAVLRECFFDTANRLQQLLAGADIQKMEQSIETLTTALDQFNVQSKQEETHP